jgi:hypothetical protein
MTTINSTFKGSKGNEIVANIEIENSKVSGTVTTNSNTYKVTGAHVIQSRKCLAIVGAPAPYMPIADGLYNEIDAICKAQYAAAMTPKEILEMEVAKAEAKYNKAMRESWNNVAIIEAREEWNRLSRELSKM